MSTTATAAIGIGTGLWKADPLHSSVGFELEHLGVSTFRGRFRDFEAQVEVGDNGTSIGGIARVDSVDVDDPQLRGHLLSPEFFDVERAPELRFEASELSGDVDELVAAGDLTIRGATRAVEARGRTGPGGVDLDGNERVGLVLRATVDRRDFGLGPTMELPNGKQVISGEVTLLAELELVKEG